MPFDPQLQALYDQRAAHGVRPLYTMTLDEARAADLAAIQADAGTPEPVREVIDESIPGPAGTLPVRIYRPAVEGPLPILVYFFGGGWTLGSIETSDAICRSLANAMRLPHHRGGLPARTGAQVPRRTRRLLHAACAGPSSTAAGTAATPPA